MNIYVADRNRLCTRIPEGLSVTATDNNSLQLNLKPAYNTHACDGAPVWSMVQYDWWLVLPRVLGLLHTAPLLLRLCQLFLLSCSTGLPFPSPKSPIPPHVPFQTEESRPQASCTGLSSPKAVQPSLLIFFPLTLFLSYPVALCQIVSLTKKVKPAIFIAWTSFASVFFIFYYWGSQSLNKVQLVYRSANTSSELCYFMHWWHDYLIAGF